MMDMFNNCKSRGRMAVDAVSDAERVALPAALGSLAVGRI
jgi:hypothetical protein